MTSEWKINKTNLLRNSEHANRYRTFERCTEIPERKVRPHCGATCGLKYVSKFCEQLRVDILKRYWSVGDINAQRILSLNVLMSHQARLESLGSCLRMCN